MEEGIWRKVSKGWKLKRQKECNYCMARKLVFWKVFIIIIIIVIIIIITIIITLFQIGAILAIVFLWCL